MPTAPHLDDLVQTLVAAWVEHLGRDRQLAPETISGSKRGLAKFLSFAEARGTSPVSLASFKRMTDDDVVAYFNYRLARGISARTLASELNPIRSFVDFLKDKKLLSTFPRIRAPKWASSAVAKTGLDDANALIAGVGKSFQGQPEWIATRDAAALSLCYRAGLFIREAVSVRRSDLEGHNLHFNGKRGKVRAVVLDTLTFGLLESYLRSCPFPLLPSEPMFRGINGGPLSEQILTLHIRAARIALGLPSNVTAWGLRRSFSSHSSKASDPGHLQLVESLDNGTEPSFELDYLLKTYRDAHPRS